MPQSRHGVRALRRSLGLVPVVGGTAWDPVSGLAAALVGVFEVVISKN